MVVILLHREMAYNKMISIPKEIINLNKLSFL